jgi:hypothetical protein
MGNMYPEHCAKLKKFWEDNDFLNDRTIAFVRSAEECLEDGKIGLSVQFIGHALDELDKIKESMDGIPPVIVDLEQIKVEISTLS